MGTPDGDHILMTNETMDSAEQALITGFKNLQAGLDSMESELKSSCESWTGDAEQAFLVVKKAWHEVFDSMGLALQQHAVLVRDTKDGFLYADAKGRAAFEDII